jgi:hypothetical protein
LDRLLLKSIEFIFTTVKLLLVAGAIICFNFSFEVTNIADIQHPEPTTKHTFGRRTSLLK